MIFKNTLPLLNFNHIQNLTFFPMKQNDNKIHYEIKMSVNNKILIYKRYMKKMMKIKILMILISLIYVQC